MRHQSRLARKQNKGSRTPPDRSRFRVALGRRISEVSERPRTIPFPTRHGIEPLPRTAHGRPRSRIENEGRAMGGGKCLPQESRSRAKEIAARSCSKMVLPRLAKNRAQTADFDC